MTYHYSAATRGFYDQRVHDPSAIPADAVPLTEEAYAALLAGQEDGKQIVVATDGAPILIDAPMTPAAVPASVTRFQARAALMLAGHLEAVEQAVAGASDPMVRLAWAESIEFPRNSPTIAALAAAIGLTETDIDNLFRAAAQITA